MYVVCVVYAYNIAHHLIKYVMLLCRSLACKQTMHLHINFFTLFLLSVSLSICLCLFYLFKLYKNRTDDAALRSGRRQHTNNNNINNSNNKRFMRLILHCLNSILTDVALLRHLNHQWIGINGASFWFCERHKLCV